jgi:hypothetical protein
VLEVLGQRTSHGAHDVARAIHQFQLAQALGGLGEEAAFREGGMRGAQHGGDAPHHALIEEALEGLSHDRSPVYRV